MRNLPEQFASVSERCADRLAVSVRREASVDRLTYRQLFDRVLAAVSVLRRHGLAAGDRCAILAENSADWCAAYLGVLTRGGIAVPFDTAYGVEQCTTLLRDCGARLLLTSERHAATARDAGSRAGCEVVLLSDVVTAPSGRLERYECPASLASPAVILYTSGTTADPKGVVLTHGNLLAEKDAAFQVVSVGEGDAVLGVLPLFHALAQMANLLLPFSIGAHVVFLETLDTRALLRALDEEGISVFCCVPQFFYLIHQRVVGEAGKGGPLRRVAFRSLLGLNGVLRSLGVNAGRLFFAPVHRTLGRRMRLLITGGSTFDPSIGRDLHALGFTILQAYGLTETSGGAAVTRPGEPIETVGRPLPGVEIRIATGTSEGAVTAGRSAEPDGEILIRGPIVMEGYWNRPDATAAVLEDGWLHTGDLGRLDRAGRLLVTGRSKEVIVLASGKNIHPGEVEAQYRRSAFIKELCVLGVTEPGNAAAEHLHALVVPDLEALRERKIVNIRELIRFELENISVTLPSYKRVLGFDVTMEPLPRTTTDKLKRHEIARIRAWLPAASSRPTVDGPVESDPHVRGVMELVQPFVRRGVTVRPESNLELDLGLDSMQRVELIAAIETRYGERLPESVAQTALLVRDLAGALTGGDAAATAAAAPWESLLAFVDETPRLRALLARRLLAATLLFVAVRCAVRVLIRPRVRGLEHLPASGPFILSPNHQSYLDPFVLAGALPFRVFRDLFFVGAVEYFESPLTRWIASQLNVVPVDPDSHLVPAMQAAAFGLRHGKMLALFPEGERSIDGRVKKFKKGAAILSRHLNVPIVPVAIDGMFEIWPRNRSLSWRTLAPWSGHRVSISVGRVIDPLPHETYEEQTARLSAEVEREMGR